MSYESKNPHKGNIIERYKQIKDEEYKAKAVEEQQNKSFEVEKKRISEILKVEGDELDALMDEYAEKDRFAEYLVDGATLTCTKATLEY